VVDSPLAMLFLKKSEDFGLFTGSVAFGGALAYNYPHGFWE